MSHSPEERSTSNTAGVKLSMPRLPERDPNAHKGDFGFVLIVGGSRGMAGAVALAGMAALRGGAGLVRLAVPDVCLDTVARFEPSLMTVPLPADSEGRIRWAARARVAELADWADVVAVGPGLGRSDELEDLVGWLYESLPKPLVVDADGLNALATQREILTRHDGPRILTPHPGEFARLVGGDLVAPQEREAAAAAFAKHHGLVLVLKGHRTCITDGQHSFENHTGNPGMATGGSGDVLTGLIAALVGQGLGALEAARLGVHLHGRAGDLGAEKLGQVSLIASDLIRFLPDAFQQMK